MAEPGFSSWDIFLQISALVGEFQMTEHDSWVIMGPLSCPKGTNVGGQTSPAAREVKSTWSASGLAAPGPGGGGVAPGTATQERTVWGPGSLPKGGGIRTNPAPTEWPK